MKLFSAVTTPVYTGPLFGPVRKLTPEEIAREYGERAVRPIAKGTARPSFAPRTKIGRAIVPGRPEGEWPPLQTTGGWKVKLVTADGERLYPHRYGSEEDAERASYMCSVLAPREDGSYQVVSTRKGNRYGNNGRRAHASDGKGW